MKSQTLSLSIPALLLAGCAAAPLSLIDGHPYSRVDPHLYPLRVVAVDGQGYFGNKPVQVAPGPHMLVLAAAPGKSALGVVEKTWAFKIEPCTSYHFAARRESPMQSDWTLVVESKEPVALCNPAEEWKKAGLPVPTGTP